MTAPLFSCLRHPDLGCYLHVPFSSLLPAPTPRSSTVTQHDPHDRMCLLKAPPPRCVCVCVCACKHIMPPPTPRVCKHTIPPPPACVWVCVSTPCLPPVCACKHTMPPPRLTQWVACLQHEALDDSVEQHVVVVAVLGVRGEVLNRARTLLWEQP